MPLSLHLGRAPYSYINITNIRMNTDPQKYHYQYIDQGMTMADWSVLISYMEQRRQGYNSNPVKHFSSFLFLSLMRSLSGSFAFSPSRFSLKTYARERREREEREEKRREHEVLLCLLIPSLSSQTLVSLLLKYI